MVPGADLPDNLPFAGLAQSTPRQSDDSGSAAKPGVFATRPQGCIGDNRNMPSQYALLRSKPRRQIPVAQTNLAKTP